jgi:hypothetical protein
MTGEADTSVVAEKGKNPVPCNASLPKHESGHSVRHHVGLKWRKEKISEWHTLEAPSRTRSIRAHVGLLPVFAAGKLVGVSSPDQVAMGPDPTREPGAPGRGRIHVQQSGHEPSDFVPCGDHISDRQTDDLAKA